MDTDPIRDRLDRLTRLGFSALMDAAADGIVVIDRNGTVLDFNSAAQRMFGLDPGQIVGQNVALLMPEPDRSRHDEYIARYLRTGEARIIGIGREVTGQREDGATFPMQLSVGSAEGLFIGIVRDLSAQKAAEEENQRLKDRLVEVDRLSLMGELAAGLAHEINQPLSAIATYAQAGERIVSHEETDTEALRKTCRDIAEQALRAGRVIHNLRNFVGNRQVVEDEVDFNRAIQDVLNLVEADATAAGIAVHTEYAPDLPPIVGDAIRLQQVLLNLTRNAVDAMRGGVRKEEGIRIRTQRAGRRSVGVEVVDRGHGCPAELANEMFQPFVSTKPGGLGVGLAVSRRIVEAYGGDLYYRSNPGGGSIFGFSLPQKRVRGEEGHGTE